MRMTYDPKPESLKMITNQRKRHPHRLAYSPFERLYIRVGAITPGLSGGVMMVVFGIYEPLLKWLADIRKNFFRNLLYFIPVGIGGVVGVIAFSAAIDKAYELNAVMFTWLIIGFIVGTYPSILRTAGKEGRKAWHIIMMLVIAGGLLCLALDAKQFRYQRATKLLDLDDVRRVDWLGSYRARLEPE